MSEFGKTHRTKKSSAKADLEALIMGDFKGVGENTHVKVKDPQRVAKNREASRAWYDRNREKKIQQVTEKRRNEAENTKCSICGATWTTSGYINTHVKSKRHLLFLEALQNGRLKPEHLSRLHGVEHPASVTSEQAPHQSDETTDLSLESSQGSRA